MHQFVFILDSFDLLPRLSIILEIALNKDVPLANVLIFNLIILCFKVLTYNKMRYFNMALLDICIGIYDLFTLTVLTTKSYQML